MIEDPHRLNGLAVALNAVTLFALVALPVLVLAGIFAGDAAQGYRDAYPNITVAALPDGGRLALLVAIDIAGLAVTLAILWGLHRLFRLYLDRRELTPETAGWLRRIGALALVQAVLGLIGPTLDILVLTAGNAPGERVLSLGIGDSELALVLAGGLLLLIGRAVAVAAAAVEENRGFV